MFKSPARKGEEQFALLGANCGQSAYANFRDCALKSVPLISDFASSLWRELLVPYANYEEKIFKRTLQPAFTLPGSLSANGFFSNLRHCFYIFIHYSIKAVSCQLLKVYKSLQNTKHFIYKYIPLDFPLNLLYSDIITISNIIKER